MIFTDTEVFHTVNHGVIICRDNDGVKEALSLVLCWRNHGVGEQ